MKFEAFICSGGNQKWEIFYLRIPWTPDCAAKRTFYLPPLDTWVCSHTDRNISPSDTPDTVSVRPEFIEYIAGRKNTTTCSKHHNRLCPSSRRSARVLRSVRVFQQLTKREHPLDGSALVLLVYHLPCAHILAAYWVGYKGNLGQHHFKPFYLLA